ncbi:MAG: cytochrome P450 [Caldilineaceae bacterium]
MSHNLYPPGPRTWPPIRLFWQMQRNTLPFLEGMARDYGDISYCRVGPRDIYLLNHPDFIHDVLVTNDRKFAKSLGLQRAKRLLGEGLLTSEGDYHLHQRRLMQPLFHRRQITAYGASMVKHAARLCDDQAEQGWQDGATLNMHAQMMQLTLGIIGETLFQQDITGEAQKVGVAMETLTRNFRRLLSPLAPLQDRLPTAENRRLRQSEAELERIVAHLISERRTQGGDQDLLSLLLMAHTNNDGASPMSNRQIRDEVLTLLLAGHETTANALTFTWWLLAQHPPVAKKMQQELDAVLGGHLPTVDDLEQLRYTRMVLAEAMRLYPPVWVIGRQALAEHTVGGYTIPAGATVLMSQWIMHRDARYYPAPQRFDPERWTPAAMATRPKFSYFPFGGGSRLCIGEHFAWMEGVLLLATLAQSWEVQLVNDTPLALRPAITLRPQQGVPLIVRRRASATSLV